MNIIEAWCLENKGDPDHSYAIRHFERNREYFQHKLDKGDTYYICKQCGAPEFAEYTHKEEMEKNQLCFHCNFWLEKVRTPGMLVVNGNFYSDGGNKPRDNPSWLGFGGSVWKIRMLDGSREWETNNLWHSGKCPSYFAVPDNAKFL